jgi:hypothetical protein
MANLCSVLIGGGGHALAPWTRSGMVSGENILAEVEAAGSSLETEGVPVVPVVIADCGILPESEWGSYDSEPEPEQG